MTISSATKLCGVIGDPIEHSLSPIMHNAAFRTLGLDFAFLAFRVLDAEVGKAISGMHALNIHGLNVTMPHKNKVIKFLDEIDPTAKTVASVNTILNKDGRLIGFNTDGVGALRALEQNGVTIKGKKVLLLGAGGAARAIAYTLSQDAEEMVILNRTPKLAADLSELLKQKFNNKISSNVLLPNTVKENLANADILINATSIGMKPNLNQTLVDPQWFKHPLAVMDIVYNPLETRLMMDAKAAGAKVVSGVEMLIYQGAASFEIWTACNAPINVMRKAVLKQLKVD